MKRTRKWHRYPQLPCANSCCSFFRKEFYDWVCLLVYNGSVVNERFLFQNLVNSDHQYSTITYQRRISNSLGHRYNYDVCISNHCTTTKKSKNPSHVIWTRSPTKEIPNWWPSLVSSLICDQRQRNYQLLCGQLGSFSGYGAGYQRKRNAQNEYCTSYQVTSTTTRLLVA